MRYSGRRSPLVGQLLAIGRGIAIAAIPASAISLLVFLSQRSELAVQAVPDLFGISTSILAIIAAVAGLSAFAGWLAGQLLGPLLPVTLFVATTAFLTPFLLVPILGRSISERVWPPFPRHLDPSIEVVEADTISAFSPGRVHLERDAEFQQLMRFAGTIPDTMWIGVAGREGYGKTRLGLEWLKALRKAGWDVGMLKPTLTISDLDDIHLRSRTAIVIDDYEFWEPVVLWGLIENLLRRNSRVRILVSGQVQFSVPLWLADASKQALDTSLFGSIRLNPLSDNALLKLAPDADEIAIHAASGRPLYALLGADYRREVQARAARRADLAVGTDEKRALALGALLGPLRGSFRQDFGIAGIPISRLERLFEGADRTELKQHLPALDPRLFANELFLAWAEDQDDDELRALIERAAELVPDALRFRLAQLWEYEADYMERSRVLGILKDAAERLGTEFANVVAERLSALLAEAEKPGGTQEDLQDTWFTGIANAVGDIRLSHPSDRGVFRFVPKIYVALAQHLHRHKKYEDLGGPIADVLGDPERFLFRANLALPSMSSEESTAITLALEWACYLQGQRVNGGTKKLRAQFRNLLYDHCLRYPSTANIDGYLRAVNWTGHQLGAKYALNLAEQMESLFRLNSESKKFAGTIGDAIVALHQRVPRGVDTSAMAVRLFSLLDQFHPGLLDNREGRNIYFVAMYHLGWVFSTNGQKERARTIAAGLLEQTAALLPGADDGAILQALWLASSLLQNSDEAAAADMVRRLLAYAQTVGPAMPQNDPGRIAGAMSACIRALSHWPELLDEVATSSLIGILHEAIVLRPDVHDAWRVLDLVFLIADKNAAALGGRRELIWKMAVIPRVSDGFRVQRALILQHWIHLHGQAGELEEVRRGLQVFPAVMADAEAAISDDNKAFGHWAHSCACAVIHFRELGKSDDEAAIYAWDTLKWLAKSFPGHTQVQSAAAKHGSTYLDQTVFTTHNH